MRCTILLPSMPSEQLTAVVFQDATCSAHATEEPGAPVRYAVVVPVQVPLVAAWVRHGADVPCAPVPLIPVAAGKTLIHPLRRGWARPAHICTGAGLAPAVFAPGLASVLIAVAAGKVSPSFMHRRFVHCPCSRALECARGRAYVRVPCRTRLGPSLCGRCAWA